MRLHALAALLWSAAASAGVIGTVDMPTGRIDLLDDEGPCVGQALRAEYVPSEGATVGGCWVGGGPYVVVVFFDADIAQIPAVAIRAPKET
jgi:hypothetical protein